MTEQDEKRLGSIFYDWVTGLPHEEVLRRYRALAPDDRMAVEGYAFRESAAALNSDEPYGDRLEALAQCFEVFMEGEDVPPMYSSGAIFRRRAHALRHPEEWRDEQAAAERNRMSERRLRALALASSCLVDDATDVRLRRIEEVLPKLNQLASQAAPRETSESSRRSARTSATCGSFARNFG